MLSQNFFFLKTQSITYVRMLKQGEGKFFIFYFFNKVSSYFQIQNKIVL